MSGDEQDISGEEVEMKSVEIKKAYLKSNILVPTIGVSVMNLCNNTLYGLIMSIFGRKPLSDLVVPLKFGISIFKNP